MKFTKKQIDKFDKMMEQELTKVGKVRDGLDEKISEMSDLRENCEEAWDNLQRARDALSELV
jgi:hypothetical protein